MRKCRSRLPYARDVRHVARGVRVRRATGARYACRAPRATRRAICMARAARQHVAATRNWHATRRHSARQGARHGARQVSRQRRGVRRSHEKSDGKKQKERSKEGLSVQVGLFVLLGTLACEIIVIKIFLCSRMPHLPSETDGTCICLFLITLCLFSSILAIIKRYHALGKPLWMIPAYLCCFHGIYIRCRLHVYVDMLFNISSSALLI